MNEIKESLEFLKALADEMQSQDTDSQASPRFWVIAETKRDYGYDKEFADGVVVCGPDGHTYKTVEEFVDFLIENEYLNREDVKDDYDYDFDEILKMVNECEFYICGYQDNNDVVAPNTMFLTKRECKEHIEKNYYHYNIPHTYAMTAWRSPQVEKLYDVLENTNWNELIRLVEKKL